MKTFKTTSTSSITFEEGGVRYFIPADEGNSDYREYLAWVAEGNTAEQWQPEQPITEEPMVEDAN